MSRAPRKSPEALPAFRASADITKTAAPNPRWQIGSGASSPPTTAATLSIDPYSPTRTAGDNYRLLVSGIIPRPIGFVSTLGSTGAENLAPFSYLSLANHDPPIFTLGFSSGTGAEKDSCRQLLETGECTINIISEDFVEAANYCAIDAPLGVSEWRLSGLTQEKSVVVKPARVRESVFSVEGKVVAKHEWVSRTTGKKTGTMVIVEGVWFHVREDALLENGALDVGVLRPVSRLGGVAYGRTTEAYDLPRPRWTEEREKEEVKKTLVEEDGPGKE
ncbi:hypothetical protein BZA05DRAFT_331810 [Tricharina praecox]|uniref:uncharacterized protein n=1 Tax=Tricharina praecox TaxID=43433 RepID=UPI00221EF413|nr:uncharacterized protein BZA05DRAFT_331810 [Tricharina praecox]KAI5857269.1 hypothetical protein BZA05DRAFT_331810 [Tricharina praecox]